MDYKQIDFVLTIMKKMWNSCPCTRINTFNFVTISQTAVRLGCFVVEFCSKIRIKKAKAAVKMIEVTVLIYKDQVPGLTNKWDQMHESQDKVRTLMRTVVS